MVAGKRSRLLTARTAGTRASGREERTTAMAEHHDAYDTAFTAWRETCRHPETAYAGPVQDGCASCDAYDRARETFMDALRQVNAADAAEGFGYVALEAHCTVCGQAFNPLDDSDLIHLMTTVPEGITWDDYAPGDPALPEAQERYCGGRGEMRGGWK
jgi:hypothetical protein